MFRRTKDVKGSSVVAQDGQIGHVKDLYFDDQTWTLRYLVVDTGHWLANRKVLISPFAVKSIEAKPHKSVVVNLTKAQIEASPSIEEHKPISRQYEAQYAQYYGWPAYWPGPLLWGPVEAPWAYLPIQVPLQPRPNHPPEGEDSHLRSVSDTSGFSGYQIQALNEVFGHVEDFLFDEQNWAIRYLVCATGDWLPGKHFLLAPSWVAWVSWTEVRVYVDLDRDAIQRAPEYDPKQEITRDYETRLFAHYNRQPYWQPRAEVISR